jgi:hypothetical protein
VSEWRQLLCVCVLVPLLIIEWMDFLVLCVTNLCMCVCMCDTDE